MEYIAIAYHTAGPTAKIAAIYGLLVVGAAVYSYTGRPDLRLSRVPYLAILAAVFLLFTFGKHAWLGASYAIAEGRLWIPFLAQVGVLIVAGFVLAFIGTARSLDATGKRKLAVLAFIPLVNIGFGFFPASQGENGIRSKQ